jgi:hypothetical protein
MAQSHIFNEILVHRTSLITGYPAAINEFKSSIFDHLPDPTLDRVVLHVPPPLKIPDLSLREPQVRVFPQKGGDITQDPFDTAILSCAVRIVAAVKVLNSCPEPACILVRVRYYV